MTRKRALAAAAGIVAFLAAASLALADDSTLPVRTGAEGDTTSQGPAPTPASSPGWSQAGLADPMIRWKADLSLLAVTSDRFGGAQRWGWFSQVAPRLSLERPPARFGAWLAYEPALIARDAGPASTMSEIGIAHQGRAGMRLGHEGGHTLGFDASRRYTLDPVRAEDAGLVEHHETRGTATATWLSSERGNLSVSVGGTETRYPDPLLRAADHRRVEASFDASARLLLRTTAGVRVSTLSGRYPHPPEGRPREVSGGEALFVLAAQITPATSLRLEGGPSVRRDPGDSGFFRLQAGLTTDLQRRLKVELAGAVAEQDSLWRKNHRVRVASAQGRVDAGMLYDVNLSGHAGVVSATYPVPEHTLERIGRLVVSSGSRISREDFTWTAGGSLSYHGLTTSRGRIRLAVSYDRSERASTFPGLGWRENRCSLSAFGQF